MATIIGQVSSLQGIVRAVNPVTGEVRILEVGSPVYAGETLQTSSGGGVVVNMQNGELLTLGRDTQMLLDDDVVGNANATDATTEAAAEVAALQQAILDGNVNLEQLEETAAGETATPGSASEGGVFVDRTAAEGEVTSGFETSTADTGNLQNIERSDAELNTTSATVSLSATQSITEAGGTVTYTATLTSPSQGNTIINLSNGQVITITDGNTVGSVNVEIAADEDVYLDAYNLNVTIVAATGGNFTSLNIDSSPAITGVNDTIDTTTVTLSATDSITEAGGTVTYTATLTHASEGTTTVTLDNGKTISIANGETSGTVDVNVAADEDVYLDAGTMSAAISSAAGGNFENLVVDSTPAVTNIIDTIDATTVSITGNASVVEGGVATYQISLDKAAATDMTVTVVTGYVENGADKNDFTEVTQDVVIKAGDTIPKDANGNEITVQVQTTDDVYAEGSENFTVSISGTKGGGFEAVTIGESVTTAIVDEVQSYSDDFIAVEDGHEFVDSDDENLDGLTEAVIASGYLLSNDELGQDGKAVIDSIELANNFSIQGLATNSVALTATKSTFTILDSNDEEYGTLTIDNTGEFTFEVNQSNSSVESLNVKDTSAFKFGYSLIGDTATGLTEVTITTEGRNDAPVIESVTANNQSVHVVSGLLDADNDGIADTINPADLTAQDKGLIFSSNNGNLQIDLGYTPSNIAVEFNGGQAGYHNAVGYYTYDSNDNLVAKIIYVDNSSFVGSENVDAGTLNNLSGKVGFFIIPNGGNNGITAETEITFVGNQMQVGGQNVTVYYTDNNLNADGHDHVIAGPAKNGSGLVIGFEDLSLGDRDYDDFVMTVKLCSPLQGGEDYFVDLGKTSKNSQQYTWDGDSKSNATWSNSDSLGNDVNVYALNFDGSTGNLLNDGNYQLGVEGSRSTGNQVPNQLHYDEVTNQSQAIVMEFEGYLNQAKFSFTRLIDSENEQGHYAAYKDGNLVAEGNLVGSGLGNNPSFGIDTGNLVFNKIVFTAVQYDSGPDNTSDTSEYYIQSFQGSGPAWANGANTILTNVNLSDVDDANLESATVTLTNYMTGDVIKADSLPVGITATVVDGVVKLTGTASVATYEQALESLTFESTSEDRTPREFEFTVFDGYKHSNTMDVTVDIGGCSLNTSVADAPFVSISVGEPIISEGTPYEAYAYNGDNFMTGNGNGTLGRISWSSVNETLVKTKYGLGIQFQNNESETGIDDNETLLLNLKTPVTSATFNLNVADDSSSFKGGWIAFDANQNEIARGHADFTSTGDTTITISDSDIGSFQYIAFDAHTSNGNASDSGFYVEPVSMTVNGDVVALATTNSVDYQVDIKAALMDRDGSESLSVNILGVPTDATLSDGIDNGDGSWTLSIPPGKLDYSAKLTLTVPEDTKDFSLRAVATATEGNGGDTAITEVDKAGDSFLHGSAEDDVFIINNDTHDSSSTHIDNFDEVNDTLDLSEVIDDSATPETLDEYLQFSYVNNEGNASDFANAASTVLNIDSNGYNTSGGNITTVYIQGKVLTDTEISDLKIDYQND